MSHPRFTVIPGDGTYTDQLTALYLLDRKTVETVSNCFDKVLSIIPNQAGRPFEHNGKAFRFIRYLGYQVVYEVKPDDCQVLLHDIRKITL